MKRTALRVAASALALVLAFACATSHAAAADNGALVVRSIDGTNVPTVRAVVQYTGALDGTGSDITVRENGRLVSGIHVRPVTDSELPIGVVIVLDASGSMRSNGRMDAAKQAIQTFVASRGAKERIGLVSFNDTPVVAHGLTADAGAAQAAAAVVPSGETSLWDAIRTAIGVFDTTPDVQPNILVLSDGTDSTSKATAEAARDAALAAHVPVNAIGLTGSGFDGSTLASVATATGGRFLATTSPTQLADLFDQMRHTLSQQFEVSWSATDPNAAVNFQLQGAVANAVVSSGGTSEGVAASPRVMSGGRNSLSGTTGLALILGLFALAGIAAAVAGVLLYNGRSAVLDTRLRMYGETGEAEVLKKDREVASSQLIRRAISWTGDAGKTLGVFGWVEKQLETARLPLRAAEASFFTFAFTLVAAVAAGIMKGPLFGLLAAVALPGLTAGLLAVQATRTTKKFVRQLPGALQLLASSLRAGYSLLQGCDAVSHEIGGPLGAELRRVLAEARLGRPIEDALERSAERMESADYGWVVMAIAIQREVGGNLAELLDTVAETMRARTRLRGEVRALTAEGRASAIMLGIMPPALGLAMGAMSPGYLDPLFKDPLGQIFLGVSVLGAVGGFFWMQKIVKVEL